MKNSNELRALGPVFRNHPNTPNTLKSTTDPYHDLYNWVKPSLMWNVEFKTFNYFSYFHAYYLGIFVPVPNDTAAFNHNCTINRLFCNHLLRNLERIPRLSSIFSGELYPTHTWKNHPGRFALLFPIKYWVAFTILS